MSPKEQAIKDIKSELRESGKSFLAFRKNLNPIMRQLTHQQIRQQLSLNPLAMPLRKKTQLIAHCFFCKGKVTLNNYTKYYK
jgi:hypothetical protein